jgi:hypothetical protein
MDEELDAWETQLAVARRFLPSEPDEAVMRVDTLIRQARAALSRRSGTARDRVQSFITLAEYHRQAWEASRQAWQQEIGQREREHRSREMMNLVRPLPAKP